MSTPLVQVRNVSHRYATGIDALVGIDFSVAEGEFVCLVGPSGCGKSTLLRIVAGLIAPTKGEIQSDCIGAQGAISFVFQDPTLMPWATVRDNVALPLRLRGEDPDSTGRAVREALERVDLADFAGNYPRALSGGMRMRASIARAIVTQPRLVLMDEPFAALDEFTRHKLNDDLLSLWQANRWTVVFVTHSIREAVFLGQRLMVMSPRPGRIAASIDVGLPAERTAGLRLSHEFADACAQVSAAFGQYAGAVA